MPEPTQFDAHYKGAMISPEFLRTELERRRTAFRTIYPETGPYNREAYKKHIEFFEAGAVHTERALLGGNRCITPWTPIEMDHATRRCGEVLGGSFHVRSWDGGSRCTKPASPVFLKALEPAFRVHLDNGQVFDCTRKHRVLTRVGWFSLGQLIRLSSGLRCWRDDEGCLASYATGDRRDGAQPPWLPDIGRELLPSSGSVRRLVRSFLPADEAGPRSSRSHVFQGDAQFAIQDDPVRIWDLCAQFEDPTEQLDAKWSARLRRDLQQFALECARRQEVSSVFRDQVEYVGSSEGAQISLGAQGKHGPSTPLVRHPGSQLFSSWSCLGEPVLEWLETQPHTAIYVPSDHCSLVGGNRILSVVCIGVQPILDFTVEDTHCYESGGVIHHNTGKTHTGSFEVVCHLTGEYPDWWKGRRFTSPTSGWAAGDTSKTVRDIMQAKLIGTPTEPSSGMIPQELVHNKRPKSGVPDAYETIYVKHKSGGISTLGLKSYDQKRESFQGTSLHFCWLDEECPADIYTETVMRTMKTGTFPGGVVFLTFTPLLGLSEVVQLFIPDGMNPSKDRFVTFLTWDDVPHLDQKEKEDRIKKIPAFQRDARTRGIPQLGAGAIYPMAESDILVDPFPIPAHWRRSYALDVGGGFNESATGGTAAIWGAINPDTHVAYLYDEYFRAGAEPSVHAQAIKNRGAWMKGVIDPAARGRSQIDGRQLLQMYRDLGLNVTDAKNAVESGIYEVWDAMSTGMLKIFNTCQNWRRERNLYRRDEKGRIVKQNDHLLDSTRYWFISGRDVAGMVPNTTRIAAAPQARTGSMGWVR